jgi:NTP pyrophosphatase (non-canonical NTP hydrolase)
MEAMLTCPGRDVHDEREALEPSSGYGSLIEGPVSSRSHPMPLLPPSPTLADLQRYVVELEVERGFQGQDVLAKALLLGEEVGELFKAVRKSQGLSIDPQSKTGHVSEELADILIYLCAIANRFGIDLEQAFRRKEEINHRRSWAPAPPAPGPGEPHPQGES